MGNKNVESSISSADIELLIIKHNKDQDTHIEHVYVKKTAIKGIVSDIIKDVLSSDPYISGLKWFFRAMLAALGLAIISFILTNIQL